MAIAKLIISKGGVKYEASIDTDKVDNQGVYEAIWMAGLEVYLGKRMTKITKKDIPSEADRKAEVAKLVEENLAMIYAGTLPGRAKRKTAKASGKVMAEARRIARQMVKDAMKEEGIKVSHVDAKEITAAANQVLEDNPEIVELAAKNIAEAEAKAEQAKQSGLNLAAIAQGIKINPDKKAKAEKAAADKKAQAALSATQAGAVATRVKGKVAGKTLNA